MAAAASGEAVLATDDKEAADAAVDASLTADVVHVNVVVMHKTRVPITIGFRKRSVACARSGCRGAAPLPICT